MACGQEQEQHQRQEVRQPDRHLVTGRRGAGGYFVILHFGNACCSSAIPASVTLVLLRSSDCRLVISLICTFNGHHSWTLSRP